VLQNDLENVAQLGEKIKCLVFDEAHRAKGNHAYCQVIRKLTAGGHQYFRVLALSATPGCNVNDVIEVTVDLLTFQRFVVKLVGGSKFVNFSFGVQDGRE